MYDLIVLESDKHEVLVNLLEDFLGSYKNRYSNKGQITFDCPQCAAEKGITSDGKGNLEINYRRGQYNCWSCGEHSNMRGSISKLFKTWGGAENLSRFYNLKLQYNYENDNGDLITIGSSERIKLPVEFNSLINAPYVGLNKLYFDYLIERRITIDLIEKFNIGFAFSGKYANRVILPSYDEDGDLNYFVTRSIKENGKYKYLNCDVEKKTIIFNEHIIDWEKTVFIVEGPFDHIVLPNSIPLLGKQLSDLLFSKIYDNAESNIVIILDPDAAVRSRAIYNKLDGGRLMGKIRLVNMPLDFDISKYNEVFGSEQLFNHIRGNTIKIID